MTHVERLAQALMQRGWMLATAESCTGGMIAARCTDLAGSSHWFERGFITYSNEAKHESLGVSQEVLTQQGAVSEATVRAMALGALRHSKAQVSVAVSGIAGPGGGSRQRPVGTVWMAWCLPGDSGPTLGAETAFIKTECLRFEGDRAAVREATVAHVLETLLSLLGATPEATP